MNGPNEDRTQVTAAWGAVRELLELLSFAIVNMDSPPHKNTVKLILDRLERFSQEAGPFSRLITSRVMFHRFEISYANNDLEKAELFCRDGMTLIGADDLQYYLLASGLAKMLFQRGELGKAFEVLGSAIRDALNHHRPDWEIADLLHMAAGSDPDPAGPLFMSALKDFAKTRCGISDEEFEAFSHDRKPLLQHILKFHPRPGTKARFDQEPPVT